MALPASSASWADGSSRAIVPDRGMSEDDISTCRLQPAVRIGSRGPDCYRCCCFVREVVDHSGRYDRSYNVLPLSSDFATHRRHLSAIAYRS